MSDNEEKPAVGEPPPTARVWFSNRTYDRLMFLAQVLLPALGTLYFTLSPMWGLPKADEVVGSITAIDAFLGLILAAGKRQYKNSDSRFDGVVTVEDNHEEGTSQVGFRVNPDSLTLKDEVTLKVKDISRGIVEH